MLMFRLPRATSTHFRGAMAAVPAVLLATTSLAAAPVSGKHGAFPLGRTAAARQITLALSLPSRDPAGAENFVAHVSKPGDPLYRHYLSPTEFAARFGANQADYDAVAAWAKAQGLTVGEHFTAGTVLPVTGSAAAWASAVGVNFNDYRDQANGGVFYAADGAPRLPAAIAGRVDDVIGLTSSSQFKPYVKVAPAGVPTSSLGSGPNGAYAAADLRTAYNVPAPSFGARTQTVAVFEQGGFDPADVQQYESANNLPAVPVRARSVDGYGTGIDNPSVELEAVLDIDMQMAMNPTLRNIVVYEDGRDSFPVALLDSLSAMATDNTAKSISISYGQDEAQQGSAAMKAENKVLTQMAAQGQAVFASAGDNGAYGDEPPHRNVADPSSQPYVTAVGGTTLFTADGETYAGEEVWNDMGIGAGATGGGVSTMWKIPDYQLRNGQSVAAQNGGSSKKRNVPDVASVGNPLTGVAVYSNLNGGWLTVGGTSVSAPIWSGFYSLVNQASEGMGFGTVGFANPAIYNLPQFGLLYPVFNDITDGTNGNPATNNGVPGYFAGYGYDNTSGLGTFQGLSLLVNLSTLPTLSGANPPPPPKGLKAVVNGSNVTLSWTGAEGDVGFLVDAMDLSSNKTLAEGLLKGHSVQVSGIVAGQTYGFVVVAFAQGGETESDQYYFTVPSSSN